MTISLELSDSLLRRVERAARERRLTSSTFIQATLEAALAPEMKPNEGSCYELAKDLAGSIRGLPKDLETNPRYMEDFGR
jgi:hypothetical protein